MSIIPFDRITCDYIKYNIWGMLLDNYLQFGKIPELPPRKDSYIDTNSCRYKALKEDAAHLLPLLNTFIYHVKKLDNSIVYTQYTQEFDIYFYIYLEIYFSPTKFGMFSTYTMGENGIINMTCFLKALTLLTNLVL